MIRALPLLLCACSAEPISNAIFYEDEDYLAALPSADDLAVPTALTDAPDGDSAVLAGAVAAGAELEALLSALLSSGEALRAAPPDERSAIDRAWSGVTAAASTDAGVRVWWVSGRIVRPEGGPIRWTIEGAAEADGAYLPLGEGSLALDGSGSLRWDREAEALLGIGAGGDELELAWEAAPSPEDRAVSIRLLDQTGLPSRAWGLYARVGLAWSGSFALTEDDLSWPGFALAAATEDGGRARGEIWRGDEVLVFETCWDAAGDTVWIGGDAGVLAEGASSACTIEEFPEDLP